MTEEGKQLLLKYLCMALPYGVKGIRDYSDEVVTLHFIIPNSKRPNDKTGFIELEFTNLDCCPINEFKPYLRPMSSMTEEEEEELNNLLDKELKDSEPYFVYEQLMVDFYLSHHLDNRLMIEKGLAIEVTKSNNPYKE